MKPNMKKKFDFSAEMSEAEAIKATPKNEYLEEEKQLLDINAKELVSLNDNVYKLRTEVENLSDSIHECKPIISPFHQWQQVVSYKPPSIDRLPIIYQQELFVPLMEVIQTQNQPNQKITHKDL